MIDHKLRTCSSPLRGELNKQPVRWLVLSYTRFIHMASFTRTIEELTSRRQKPCYHFRARYTPISRTIRYEWQWRKKETLTSTVIRSQMMTHGICFEQIFRRSAHTINYFRKAKPSHDKLPFLPNGVPTAGPWRVPNHATTRNAFLPIDQATCSPRTSTRWIHRWVYQHRTQSEDAKPHHLMKRSMWKFLFRGR